MAREDMKSIDEAVQRIIAGARPSPIVADYIKYLEKGTTCHSPADAKRHYHNAIDTYSAMTAKAKKEAEKLRLPRHVAWLRKATEDFD